MTETNTAHNGCSGAVHVSQMPCEYPVLQTYSRRNRPCIQASTCSTSQACLQTDSALKSGRQALHHAAHPFVRCSHLQHPKTLPQQPRKRSFTQLHLDVGQADFACITCSVCGLIYAKGEANDEKVHASFHAKHTQGVQFQGWQQERVVKWDGRAGRVLLVLPTDSATHLNKVKEICTVVEGHLGLCKGWLLASPCQVYLYVSSSKVVLGCVIAERITSASPVIPTKDTCVTSACSTATGAPCFGSALPSTPQSVPPLAKHPRLSFQLPARSAASVLPHGPGLDSPICIKSADSQRQDSCAEAKQGLQGMEMGSAWCGSQQQVSMGSNQSGTVALRSVPTSSHQPRKHLKKTLLTHWLATGKGKSADVVQTAPSRMLADSPTSAGSAAASKHDHSQSTAETRPEQRDISSPIPMLPLTDITNVVADSNMSEANAAMPAQLPHAAKTAWCRDQCDCMSDEAVACTTNQEVPEAQTDSSAPVLAHCDHQLPSSQKGHCDTRVGQLGLIESEEGVPQAAGCRLSGKAEAQHDLGEPQDTSCPGVSRQRPELQTDVVMADRSKAVKAVCGIKVMWVSAQARRRGIATQLLDTCRCNCVAGYVVSRNQLAFSQPTKAGRCLAQQYTQTHSFLVYQ